jgi:hypothetical protein
MWLHTHIVQSEVSAAPCKSADTQVDSRECMLRQYWSMSLTKDVSDTNKLK